MTEADVSTWGRLVAAGDTSAPGRTDSVPGREGSRRPTARGAVTPAVAIGGFSAVIFDVGGVFTFPDPAVLQRALGSIGPISLTTSRCRHAHYRAVAALSRSQQARHLQPWESYYQTFASALGVATPGHVEIIRTLFEEMDGRLWRDVDTDNIDVAKRLASTGLRLGVLSNADGTVEHALRDLAVCHIGRDRPGARVEFLVNSTGVGVAKPDRRIDFLAIDRLGVHPDDVVYVGDNPWSDVHGPAEAGMNAILLDPLNLHPHVASRVGSLSLLEQGRVH